MRAQVLVASLRHLEVMEGSVAAHVPQMSLLIDTYRRRLDITHDIGKLRDASKPIRAAYFGAALAAVAAGRTELIRMH